MITENKLNNIRIEQLRNHNMRKNVHPKQTQVQFDSVLQQKINQSIQFSKHANQRLVERNIVLSQEDITKLTEAIEIAKKKGIRNSLIVADQVAYIANIKSRTIVTVMENIKGKVFTNVDGVINI